MLLALLFTVVVLALTLVVAKRRRIHHAILALVAAAVGSGGVAGTIPGAFILLGLITVAATGPSSGINWAFWTTLAACGTLAGIAGGAGVAGMLSRPHVNRVALRAASTALFALVGVGLSAIVLAATSPTALTGELFSVLITLVTATSVFGFVLPPRGK